MSLKGDLRTMPLPDVLQWLATGRKTGTLHVERRSVRKKLILQEGQVHSSWSNDPREYLGQFLFRLRLITEEQLFKALLIQEAEGRLLGSILLEQGILTEEELRGALAAKAEETLYDLFLWPEGHFEFHEGEMPEQVAITIDTSVTPVVLEGIRRVDDWQRIQAVFPTMDTTLQLAAPLASDATDEERLMVVLAAEGCSLTAIALELRRSEFDTASLAFGLYARGHLAIRATRPAGEATDPVGAIQALLTMANERLAQGRIDSALQAFEDVLAIDHLNQSAKKGLLATAEARARARHPGDGTPHAGVPAAPPAWSPPPPPAPPERSSPQPEAIPRHAVPAIAVDMATLTRQNLDPHEGFVLSRVNGEWDVQSILALCPIPEDETLAIFSRLLERQLIRLS